MGDQDGLTVCAEQHEVGLPVPWLLSVRCGFAALMDTYAMFDEVYRAAAAPAGSSSAMFAARQEAVPVILLRRSVVDEAVD